MLFRRRSPLGVFERVRLVLWPTSGWRRSFSYIAKRVLRLSGSPHAIAAGFAAGVFASFTPFFFFHFLISVFVAFLIGGNLLAAMLGTAIGNPFTFPAIYLMSYKFGNILLGRDYGETMPDEITEGLATQPWEAMLPILGPWLVGGITLGLGFGLTAYVIVLFTVKKYQKARRLRLQLRRERSGEQSGSVETQGSV